MHDGVHAHRIDDGTPHEHGRQHCVSVGGAASSRGVAGTAAAAVATAQHHLVQQRLPLD